MVSACPRSSGTGSASVRVCLPGLDLDCAVAAAGSDEFLDAPAGLVLNPVGDGQGGEHHGQVGVDGLTPVVVRSAIWMTPCWRSR